MSNVSSRYLRVPALLEQLARTQHPQTLAQLAQRLDLPKTTLMRILQSLVEAGLVVDTPNEKGYVLGPRATLLALATLRSPHFSRTSRAILGQLVQVLGETCNLTTLEGDQIRYLDRVETHHLLRLQLEVGTHVPLHCTASGKLMLASMDADHRRQILDRISLERFTPRTLIDRQQLESELANIRQRGLGVDREEFVLGMVAVAVPVLDAQQNVIAAVACHGPTARVSMEFLLGSVPVLQKAAIAMGRALGDDTMSW
ncbi:IclR family transcriptional regulator [Paralcaligenes ureilyticus]|uniref:IclR family transcriptional regulator n=1 Tax=Paralcaligenes ureilyticus TaxID=627131 RepID=A0A4R3M5B4_9BURK|nr:IclR family transcriptional regulator [Paralcaligenes ureilyticus]TCT07459.1 IclR family transcriptional regulator [Paralcaligenes ureilyticus]